MRQAREFDQAHQLVTHDMPVSVRREQRGLVNDGANAGRVLTSQDPLPRNPELDGPVMLDILRPRIALAMNHRRVRLSLEQPRDEERLVADDVRGAVLQFGQIQQRGTYAVPVLRPPSLA
ncbi:hypothetical protein GCM10010307_59160 [Streptomyces vastus]|uniref:Uncharacterized protein n=1 Tax=Streptomyces vastus TaxID=285451 RepID=A0ABP6DPW7_9ACTN